MAIVFNHGGCQLNSNVLLLIPGIIVRHINQLVQSCCCEFTSCVIFAFCMLGKILGNNFPFLAAVPVVEIPTCGNCEWV